MDWLDPAVGGVDEPDPAPGGMDREAIRLLSRRSNARGFAQLAMHAALLTATGTLVWASLGSAWVVPAVIVHGIALNFLFCALHETVHRTAFASRSANDIVAWGCGAVLLLPRDYFRLFHFAHHRFAQDPDRDPELLQPHPVSMMDYVWRASGLPNWKRRVTVTLRHALTGRVPEPFIPAAKRETIIREARVLWACYAAVLAFSLVFRRADALIYWILPVLAGQPFLRLYLLSEHAGCASSDDIFANTRTTYTSPVVRFLAWQMPFHVEHHAYPAIPFHALGKVNGRIRSRITVSGTGYLAVHRGFVRQFLRSGSPRAKSRSLP